ncbi:MAG: ribonuclease III [Opitutales bacterium]|nr:ribonuclease III [Opitutales bacterium]
MDFHPKMIKKYIKRLLKPSVAKRAKAMNRAKKARTNVRAELRRRRLAPLEEKLGYVFEDKSILVEALTHAGLIGVSKAKIKSNQRLEFLGDSILQSIITDAVFKKFGKSEEGMLTKIRIALTQGSFLAELSRDLTIPEYLNVPKGSENIRSQPAAAEDAFEAVVGALYLDSSFEKARDVVLTWYRLKLDNVTDLMSTQNPKGALQETVAKSGKKIEYVLLSQSGPDHKKVFEIEVRIDGLAYARASSSSKKNAEAEAAKQALKLYLSQLENAEIDKTVAPTKKSKKKSEK